MNTQVQEDKFYATFKEADTEIAIFQTAEERDMWVSYQDWLSVLLKITAEDCVFERIPLSREEAVLLSGGWIDLPELFYEDDILSNILWVSVM